MNLMDDMYKSMEVKRMMEAYDAYINAVAKNIPNFNDEKSAKLAIMLNNVDKALQYYEATQANHNAQGLGGVGNFKTQALALISATMPNLIAEEIVSVQPMALKTAQIFFLRYKFGSNKGRIKAGDVMFDRHAQENYNPNYTSEVVLEEECALGDGANKDFDISLAYTPVKPGTVVLVVEGNEGNQMSDDGNGKIVGTGVTEGKIDYRTGKVILKLATAPADKKAVLANYDFDLEFAPSTIPEIELEVTETTVRARARKLKALYAFDAGYDLKMSQGLDIDEALLNASIAEIKSEIDGEIMLDLLNGANSAIQSTWNKNYSSAVQTGETKRDHDLTFIDEIVSAGNAMFQKTRRAIPNILIVGKWGGDVLDCIGAPRYVPAPVNNAIGPHFAGTIDGRIRVYKNPYFAEKDYVLMYKGASILDSAYVYAPYLPIMSTQTLMLDDFIGRKGFATSYGKKMVNNMLVIRGEITNTPVQG